jgi:hypothetical protein
MGNVDIGGNLSTKKGTTSSINLESKLFDIDTNYFNISTDNFTTNSSNYTITGTNLNLIVDESNVGIKKLTLSGDDITLTYNNTFKIQYCTPDGVLKPVLVLDNDNNKPTSSFPNNTDTTNPINGCINKAMWA